MSKNLLYRYDAKNYIQSPVDDIDSFLWVTLYAILNNTEPRSVEYQRLAKRFEDGYRAFALDSMRSAELGQGLFSDWDWVTINLSGRYGTTVEVLSTVEWLSGEEEAQYWKAAWHGYALEGVCKTLEVIFTHVAKMK